MLNSKSIFNLAGIALTALLISTCTNKEEATPITGTGNLKIEFDNRANGEELVLEKNTYTTSNGDVVKFSKFNYYVSNFSFVTTDGTIYTVPKNECYFLIKETDGKNTEIELKNIPAGDYKEVRFIVGIDSSKSVSPISERTGILDPAKEGADMYWSWNSGYIFVKVEGTSPQAPTTNNQFRYHIGLFGGYSSSAATINNIKSISLRNDDDIAKVRTTLTPHFHITADVMEIFKTPTTISIAANPIVMVSPFSATIATNYGNMFTLNHIHN